MTTHILTGSAIYSDAFSNAVVGVDSTGVTQEFVVADTVTSLSYIAVVKNPNVPATASFSVDAYHVSFDGRKFQPPKFPDAAFVLEFDWTDITGVARSTVVLDYIALDATVDGFGQVDVEYLFVIGGDALPPLETLDDYTFLEGSLAGVTNATGIYAPDTAIAFTALGGTVSENDVIRGGGAGNTLLGGIGKDALFGFGGSDTLRGGAGADKLDGGKGRDALLGGGGNDRLLGGAGNDALTGGNGADVAIGGAGSDVLNGGKGADRLFGRQGADQVSGGRGDDLLDGGDGDDVLTGGQGRDVFVFSAGNDVLTDFNAAIKGEKIDLSAIRSIKGFGDLIDNHATGSGGAVIIDDLGGNTLTLNNVAIADLGAGDFIF